MTSGGNGKVIVAPASQRPPSTTTSQGNHFFELQARSVSACQTTAGGSGRYR